ncbi:hypothetical protein HAX54_025191 [Datura stramonium]|uniref:Uncharacterized protein n=1 Tax=Datura stramonium TaxID=4076 RepID=A0ABS8S7I2_DATST|nr:hypothetical protein [Datura stramonium]
MEKRKDMRLHDRKIWLQRRWRWLEHEGFQCPVNFVGVCNSYCNLSVEFIAVATHVDRHVLDNAPPNNPRLLKKLVKLKWPLTSGTGSVKLLYETLNSTILKKSSSRIFSICWFLSVKKVSSHEILDISGSCPEKALSETRAI